MCTKNPPTRWPHAGVKIGSTGGVIVDERMATSVPASSRRGTDRDPAGSTRVPLQGLTGSHAYAQGKIAGINAGGGSRLPAVYVPWGPPGGKWIIGGASFGETPRRRSASRTSSASAKASREPATTRVRKPGQAACRADARLIGAQIVGGEGIKERADFLAMAVKFGFTFDDLATMENVYSPAIGALNEPIVLAAQNGLTG